MTAAHLNVTSATGLMPVLNPFNDTVVGSVEMRDAGDIDNLMARARQGASLSRALPRHVRASILESAAQIDILAIPSLGTGAIASAVGEFLISHPGINVRFSICMSRQISEMVAQNRVDIGFVHGSSSHPSIKESFITETDLHCLMRKSHPLSSLTEITALDLSPYPLISFDVEAPPSVQIREAFSRAGLQANVRIEINASLLAAEALRDETVAFVDPLSVKPDPELTLLPFTPKIPLSIFMLTHQNKTPSMPVAAFCDTARHLLFRAVNKPRDQPAR